MALPIVARNEISELDISRLAREIARDLRPLEFILEQQGISNEAYDRIKESPIFQTRLVEEAGLWAATTRVNLRERVSVKAAIAIEELLGDAIMLVKDPEVPGAARVQALQFIAKLGHLGEGPVTKDDGSGRVTINIMIGDKKLSFAKDTATDVTDQVETMEHATP